MTTRYLEFLSAYDANPSFISNINRKATLLYQSYIPNELHTFLGDEIKGHILASGGSLNGSEFKNNPMGVIMDLLMDRVKLNISENQTDTLLYIEEFDSLVMDDEVKQKFRDLIYRSGESNDYMNNWWQQMKDNGAKYIIIESPNNKKYCWCELI